MHDFGPTMELSDNKLTIESIFSNHKNRSKIFLYSFEFLFETKCLGSIFNGTKKLFYLTSLVIGVAPFRIDNEN